MSKLQFIRMPFVIGVHGRENSSEPQYTHRDQDAFMSSVAFLVLLAACGGSMVLLQWTTPQNNKHILIPSVEIFISLMLVAAIALIISFTKCTPNFVFKKTHKDLIILPSEVKAKSCCEKLKIYIKEVPYTIRRVFKYEVALAGVVILLIPSLLLHFMQMVAHFICMPVFVECDRLYQYLTSAIYQIVRIAFMVSVCYFAIRYHSAEFISTPRVRYSIVVILASVMTSWFDISFHEIIETFIHDSHGGEHNEYACLHEEILNDTFVNDNSICLAKETEAYKVFHRAAGYLFPLNIEFSLLILEILFHLFTSVKQVYDKKNDKEKDNDDIRESVLVIDHTEIELDKVTGYIENESTSTNGQINQQKDETHKTISPVRGRKEKRKSSLMRAKKSCSKIRKTAFLIACITLCIVINTFHLTTGILTYYDVYHPFHWSRLLFRIILILFILRAYQVSHDFESNYHPYNGLELVVLASSIGCYIFNVLALVAEISWWSKPRSSNEENMIISVDFAFLGPFINLLNLLQVYIQSTFIVYASRVKCPLEDSTQNVWFKACVLFVAVCNLTEWGVNSFILNKNELAVPIPFHYFEDNAWSTIIHVILPFALFFRFNSFLLLVEAWMQDIKKRNGEGTVIVI